MDNVTLTEARLPRYLSIARRLKADIEAGYAEGDYLPSERTLQKTFGVTIKTIRTALDVLAREGLVESLPYRGTVVRMRPANGQMGGPGAASLSSSAHAHGPVETESRKGQTMALVMPLEEYLLALLPGGIERELRRHGHHLRLCGSLNLNDIERDLVQARRKEREILESLQGDDVAGVIWWSAFGIWNRDAAQALQQQGLPVVLLDNPVPGLNCDIVGIDDYGAARVATLHLAAQGRRDIAFWGFEIGDFIPPVAGERLAGFLDGLAQIEDSPLRDTPPLATQRVGTSHRELVAGLPDAARERIFFYDESTVDELLSRQPRPNALLVANDHLAYALLPELAQRGVRVPEDLTIASFGDIERFSRRPTDLTTVRQPFAEMGQRAVRLLLQRLVEPDLPPRNVQLPAQLIVRRSCGAPTSASALDALFSPLHAVPMLS